MCTTNIILSQYMHRLWGLQGWKVFNSILPCNKEIFISSGNSSDLTTQCNNYHMTERTHVPRGNFFVMMMMIMLQLIYKVLMGGHHLRYPLPYPLPGFLATTLPEVKKPYPSEPGQPFVNFFLKGYIWPQIMIMYYVKQFFTTNFHLTNEWPTGRVKKKKCKQRANAQGQWQKVHDKCIFHPLHKSVLTIKESYWWPPPHPLYV